MSKFLTRVVLHGVKDHDREEYDRLHDAMEKKGFSRTIRGDDGITYKLPPAEYYCSATVTSETVRTEAAAAARSVQAGFSVLVTMASEFSWINLERET